MDVDGREGLDKFSLCAMSMPTMGPKQEDYIRHGNLPSETKPLSFFPSLVSPCSPPSQAGCGFPHRCLVHILWVCLFPAYFSNNLILTYTAAFLSTTLTFALPLSTCISRHPILHLSPLVGPQLQSTFTSNASLDNIIHAPYRSIFKHICKR